MALAVLIFSEGFDTYNQVFAQSALLSPSSFFLLQIHNVVWWKENNQILHCLYVHVSRYVVKVCFTQKMLVKWSKCHSSEPFFTPEESGKFKMMNGTYRMLIF